MKPWSSKSVASHLNYLDKNSEVNTNPKKNLHHIKFADFLTFIKKLQSLEIYYSEHVSVFDVGCGTARILNFLPDFYDKYVGTDINESVLEIAQEINNKHNTGKNSLLNWDIEGSSKINKDTLKHIEDCNICYLDSTFTMLENPENVLIDFILPNFDICYFGRTTCSRTTSRGTHCWSGMPNGSTSPLWEFCQNFWIHTLEPYRDSHLVWIFQDHVVLWKKEKMDLDSFRAHGRTMLYNCRSTK